MAYIYVRKYYYGARKESGSLYFAPGVMFDGCGSGVRDESAERRFVK